MATHTRYTAQARRDAQAASAARHEARRAELAAGTFEDYLDAHGYSATLVADPAYADIVADLRDDYNRLAA